MTIKLKIFSWEDLTFAQYLAVLRLNGNEADLLSIFTGIEASKIAKAKIEGIEAILASLDFMKEPPKFDKVPDKFMGLNMPKDITFKSLGPYIDCKDILSKQTTESLPDFLESYTKYCAIYVQAIKANWENYDYDEALKLIPEVMNQPAWEVVGLGNFFITKFYPLKKNTQTNSHQAPTRQKKSKRGTKS